MLLIDNGKLQNSVICYQKQADCRITKMYIICLYMTGFYNSTLWCELWHWPLLSPAPGRSTSALRRKRANQHSTSTKQDQMNGKRSQGQCLPVCQYLTRSLCAWRAFDLFPSSTGIYRRVQDLPYVTCLLNESSMNQNWEFWLINLLKLLWKLGHK